MKAFLARTLVLALPCLAVAQIATIQIKVIEGEGAAHPAGAKVSRPITVQVTDEAGQPVAGAAVSFQLPPEGPSGLFSNGLRTDLLITDTAGRATIHAMQLNRSAGQVHIRITAVKEQARAGIISSQFINEAQPAPAAAAVPAPAEATAKTPAPAPSASASVEAPSAERSAGLTPTTVKMKSHLSKKWIIVAAVAVAGGAAALGVSRAASKSSSVSSTVISIGTPTITIGNPNQ